MCPSGIEGAGSLKPSEARGLQKALSSPPFRRASMISWVFFDLGGTLLDDSALVDAITLAYVDLLNERGFRVTFHEFVEVRDLMIDWVERHPEIATEPNNNWGRTTWVSAVTARVRSTRTLADYGERRPRSRVASESICLDALDRKSPRSLPLRCTTQSVGGHEILPVGGHEPAR